ncbi:MAG: arginine--tRNA ligase, partial [Pseudomonadota bacterium]
MKHHLQELVKSALHDLTSSGALECELPARITIERTRDKSHGDFACNIAMVLAKPARSKPRDLAERIVAHLPPSEYVARVEIAGPGFINITMAEHAYHAVVGEVHEAGEAYGRSTIGAGQRVQVEFVSANPTGPLHVGHGRGAAYGATVADLLAAAGFEVHREYYVNDAGRQMDILATSIWLRYLELAGETFTFPANGYKGDYVWDIAAGLHRENGDAYRHATADVFDGIPADEPDGGDKEAHIDALIMRAKKLLGAEDYRKVFDQGL